MTLKKILHDLCRGQAWTLRALYQKVPQIRPGTKETTIRGTIYQNRTLFRRLGPGLYIAVQGEAVVVLVKGDAWDLIGELDDNSIDAIIADMPPTWLNKRRAKSHNGRGQPLTYETRTPDQELLRGLLRVIKKNKAGMTLGNYPKPGRGGGYMFLWSPNITASTMTPIWQFIDMAQCVGWTFHKFWPAVHGRMGGGYAGRTSHDNWMLFSAPARIRPFDETVVDSILSKFIEGRDRCHQSEKHPDTFTPMIRFATQRGDVILDAFAGGLSVLRQAVSMGRHAIGFEIDQAVIDRAMGESP